jgi:mono/diheme cytochrome c family protein
MKLRRVMKRLLVGLAVLLVLGTAGVAIAVVIRENRTFDAPYPALHASDDPAVIARGRYLVAGPAHCVSCHSDPSDDGSSPDAPLSGGRRFDLPVGTFYVPNITPDPTTGIGRYTDPELARALRYGVHPTGRAVLPFMAFADLADADLVAILSYLRSRPAVAHRVPSHDVNLKGRIAKAFVLEPWGPTRAAAPPPPRGPTAAYGEYLATSVANCVGCHSRRDLASGAFTGPRFAGGHEMASESDPSAPPYVTPNLTPDPETGRITAWSEDVFVARFQHATRTASPMPWETFARMDADDLRAIYRYLRSLPPVTTR